MWGLGTLSVVVLVLLLHPGRFSEQYFAGQSLSASQLLNELSRQADLHDPKCELNMKALKSHGSMKAVTAGGHFSPVRCQSPLWPVHLIVPYRDRPDQMLTFINWMHPFLQAQNLTYTIWIVEQAPGKPFNRAKLLNVGFNEAAKAGQPFKNACLIFHDVDLLPLNAQNLYGCPTNYAATHLSAHVNTLRYNLPYWGLTGGAVAIKSRLFEDINGFSNRFFGWGGEDDDFRMHRLNQAPVARYSRDLSIYRMLPHAKETPSEDRHGHLSDGSAHVLDDGLNSLNYTVMSLQLKPLYTHVIADI